ncbi:MAG: PorT family protein [Chitinophagaceae bacterium]|jgi:hypothetical protein|nr:PorT family protein [Chitinophagaceae bacterium]
MKFLFVFLSGAFALFSTTYVAAQSKDVSIGFRTGMTIPSITSSGDNPITSGYSTTNRFGVGVFAEFKINHLFSLQPMLEYVQEGAKKNGMQALYPVPDDVVGLIQQIGQSVPDYLYANINNSAKINYLMLPVLAKFGWDIGQKKSWRFYVDAGPYIGLLTGAKQITSGTSDVYLDQQGQLNLSQLSQGYFPGSVSFDNDTTITGSLHRFNFGLEGNVGIQYQIKRSRIFIEGGGNYGLMNIQKYPDIDGKNHIGAVTIMIGYAYRL